MALHIPMPRLLPLTIITLATSLTLHGVTLVQAWLLPDRPALGSPLGEMVPSARAEGLDAAKPPPKPGAQTAAPPANQPSTIAPPVLPAEPAISDSERALLQDLRARRGAIDSRAATVAEREAMLSAAEKRIGARLDELTALQQRLETLDAARKQREEANWQGMVKVYETMKPRDAATIFNDLDMPVLLQVLDRMKEAKAATILGAMQPERARQATTQLAQMRIGRESVPNG